MLKTQKKIWITGASSGIGKALAEKFAKENWKVAVSARREDLLNKLAQNENISAFPLDVTDDQKIKEAFSKILNEFNDLDLCVFCTGAYEPKLEQEINKEQIKKIMNINFFGILNCVTAIEDYFKNKKEGHISIVSSVAAYRGLPNSTGYGPSKAALTNFTESLYFDFKKYNVRVSLVSPGFIKTPLTDKNTFPMPFIKSPEYAANKMYKGLANRSKFEISFPVELVAILKVLRILPYRIYLFLVDKFLKRTN